MILIGYLLRYLKCKYVKLVWTRMPKHWHHKASAVTGSSKLFYVVKNCIIKVSASKLFWFLNLLQGCYPALSWVSTCVMRMTNVTKNQTHRISIGVLPCIRTSRGGWMSWVPTSCSGRSRNLKIAGLSVTRRFETWLS